METTINNKIARAGKCPRLPRKLKKAKQRESRNKSSIRREINLIIDEYYSPIDVREMIFRKSGGIPDYFGDEGKLNSLLWIISEEFYKIFNKALYFLTHFQKKIDPHLARIPRIHNLDIIAFLISVGRWEYRFAGVFDFPVIPFQRILQFQKEHPPYVQTPS